jgi:hypothetical protein
VSAIKRVQLSRRNGWRMPADTVKVDRSTPWGNPFVTGKHGTRAECVRLHMLLMAGFISIGEKNYDDQIACRKHVAAHREELRGKHLACWCPLYEPCHADVLLEIANA